MPLRKKCVVCKRFKSVVKFYSNRGQADRKDTMCKSCRVLHVARMQKKKGAEYRIWGSLRQRCYNPKQSCYAYYGGRGIRVCRRWKKFKNFLADMGKRPTVHHQLERKDKSKGYSPANCQWTARSEIVRNACHARLTSKKVREIRELWQKGVVQSVIATRYHVAQGYVSLIVNKRIWKKC